nr:hypothetical protein [Ktedonobacter sp. SOSP1-85]
MAANQHSFLHITYFIRMWQENHEVFSFVDELPHSPLIHWQWMRYAAWALDTSSMKIVPSLASSSQTSELA